MIMIDKLAYASSLRSESPYLKSFFAIANLIICVSASSNVISGIMLLFMGGCAVYFSKASFTYYMKLLLLPAVFMLISSVTIIVDISKVPLDVFALPVGSYYLTGSGEGFRMAFESAAKALGCVSCLYFLILTTPVMDLIEVLRTLRVPSVVIELMMLMYRFIFILLDMGEAILTAQTCRLGHKNMKRSIQSTGHMLAVLFVRAYQKADAVYNAMEVRCYDGSLRVLTNTKKASRSQTAAVILAELMLGGVGIACSFYGW